MNQFDSGRSAPGRLSAREHLSILGAGSQVTAAYLAGSERYDRLAADAARAAALVDVTANAGAMTVARSARRLCGVLLIAIGLRLQQSAAGAAAR